MAKAYGVAFWEGYQVGYKRALREVKERILLLESSDNPLTNGCSKLEQTEGNQYDEKEEIKAGGTD